MGDTTFSFSTVFHQLIQKKTVEPASKASGFPASSSKTIAPSLPAAAAESTCKYLQNSPAGKNSN
ncbi:MAG: hypothetical protein K8I00_00295, partial [Candidatus Omnitrophica bacterium]|nr:hypothetical protein [Candidatus Omnitrophota bacterium]